MALKHANSGMKITLLRKGGDELKKTPSMVVESECDNGDGMLVIRPVFGESRENTNSSSGSSPAEELQSVW